MPPLAFDTYARSLPSRDSVGQQKAEVRCLVSISMDSSGRFHNQIAAMPMATNRITVVNTTIRALSGSGVLGSASEPKLGTAEGCTTRIGPATGAMKRYPRRGTVSTYLG